MRVVQASFYRDPQKRPAETLLAAWPSLIDVAQGAHAAGVDVAVVQAHHTDETITSDGVQVRFTTDPIAHVHAFAPDVLHLHGISNAEPVPANGKPFRVLVQDHGGGVPARWRQPLLRRRLRTVDGAAFTAREQADAYRFVLPPAVRVFEVLESSTHFQPGDQEEARALTGMGGDPCVLWVGRLDANKDPLTVLEAVRRAVPELPGLQLYCCYGATELLGEVRATIERSAELRGRVHLLGAVPHERVQMLARAADLYVGASHSEGSGYALIEAIACGLTPIVTDIPSFRQITGRGAVGSLVPLRDADAMAAALVAHARLSRTAQRAATLEHFQRNLSFAAVGQQLRAAYEALLA
jgi:glycosyltransferase involved in cell wall biosynthesis